jgi:hypothetical protein
MKRRFGAIALSVVVLIVSLPPRANAQAVIGVPVVETFIGIVIIGGIAYELYRTSQGQELTRPVTMPATSGGYFENPDDEGEWGVYPAKDKEQCHYKAAGRPYEWLGNGKCKIKG